LLQIHNTKSGSLKGRLRPPVVTAEAVPPSISGMKHKENQQPGTGSFSAFSAITTG
jgi:hypothetical protein